MGLLKGGNDDPNYCVIENGAFFNIKTDFLFWEFSSQIWYCRENVLFKWLLFLVLWRHQQIIIEVEKTKSIKLRFKFPFYQSIIGEVQFNSR